MSIQIYYNGQLASPSGQPIPLFGESNNFLKFGERWCDVKTITLRSNLTGCTYNSIQSAKLQLEQIYSNDFRPLSIIQDGQTVYYSPYNKINNITFDDSIYVGVLGYSVSLESYPPELFSGHFGVIEPVNEWNFVQQDNQLLEITHRISARGINTSSGFNNAFQNAKDYVLSLTGSNSFITPYFINYCTGINLCIDTFKEDINRFENIYTIEERYIADMYNGGAGYIRYSADYNCDINRGLATLSLNGEVKSCKNADLATLRAKYNTFDVYSAAMKSYSDACNRIDLNPTYLSSGISEDNYNKKITFNIQFDNDFTPKTYFDYSTEIKIDELDITTVDIRGTIKGRGDLQNRWQNVQNYYNNQLNLFYLASQAYLDFNNGVIIYPLNPIQQNYSVSKNPFIGEISVSTSYNNKDILPVEMKDLDYTVSFHPAFYQIQSLPLVNLGSGSVCNSNYYTVNLNYLNRAGIELRGRIVGSCTGNYNVTLGAIKNLANNTILSYGTTNRIFLDKNNVSQSNEFIGNDLNFNFSWSFESNNSATIAPFNYINTLKLN
jgi:hypothetical protein